MKVVQTIDEISVSNAHLKIQLKKIGEVIIEHYSVRENGGGSVLVISNRDSWDLSTMKSHSNLSFIGDGKELEVNFNELAVITNTDEMVEVKCSGKIADHPISQRIRIFKNEKYLHFTIQLEAHAKIQLNRLLKTLVCAPNLERVSEWDFVFIPNLRPKKNDIIGDHVFRSPLILLKKNESLIALVPDLKHLKTETDLKTCLDFQLDGSKLKAPLMAFGFQNYRATRRHVYYKKANESIPLQAGTIEFAFYLILDGEAESYAHLPSFIWNKFAREYIEDLRPQLFSFEYYNARIMDYLTKRNPSIVKNLKKFHGIQWQTFRSSTPTLYRTGAKLLGFNAHFVLFQPWFNNLRTAFGLYYWAQKQSNNEVLRIAEGIKELILVAPEEQGIFPTVCDLTGGDLKWMKGTKALMSHNNYHTADCASACYWMLLWHDYLEQDPRLLEKCRHFGDFLITVQLPSGAIPSWLDIRNEKILVEEALRESANSCCAGFFLTELYRRTRETKYLNAAKKVAEFTMKEVLPQQKWFDYETFFSCSRKKLTMQDSITGLYPQNNLSIYWASCMFKNLYELESNPQDLKHGLETLAVLSLYQQVWNPPFISIYAFGGMGCMNTDAEWNDSRQAVFSRLYFEWSGLIKELKLKRELFLRGIAALRAAFTLMLIPEHKSIAEKNLTKISEADYGVIAENYGHSGTDKRIMGYLMFDWGCGTASSASALTSILFGDIFIDVESGLGFGINGTIISDVSIEKNRLSFSVVEKVPDKETFTLKVSSISSQEMELYIDGSKKGFFSKQDLEKGIEITL